MRRSLLLFGLLVLAAPSYAVRVVGSFGRPVTLTPVAGLPLINTPLSGTFGSGPGAISLQPSGVFDVLPSPSILPATVQAARAEAAESAEVLPEIKSARINQAQKKGLAAASAFSPAMDSPDMPASLNNLFDGSKEHAQTDVKPTGTESESGGVAFAAKSSWLLGRTADELGAAKGQTSGKMTTHDFVGLLREAQEQFIKTHESEAPTREAFKAAVTVNESIIRIVAALGKKNEPLHNQIRRILSVWQIFNQAMEEAAERGTLGDVIGEAKLFAYQVEQSIQTPDPLKITDTGIIETGHIETALKALREASHSLEPNILDLLKRISEHHPELPLKAERVFLIKDQAMMDMLGLPSDAAGAARILSDGKRQEPIILLVAPKGIAADDFVEFVIHEAVHLMDGGILYVENERAIEHWLAEGYTQQRAHEMANASLEKLGRHARKNPAYNQEVNLAEAFISKYGTAALEDLVQNGSSKSLQAVLGDKWVYVKRLMEFDNRSMQKRANLLNALYAVIMTPDFKEEQFAYLVKHFGLSRASL
jgi:hypothetical protein